MHLEMHLCVCYYSEYYFLLLFDIFLPLSPRYASSAIDRQGSTSMRKVMIYKRKQKP